MTHLTLDKLPKKVLARIDLQTAFAASRCVIAAERLQLFRKLHGRKLTAAALGRKIGITGWRLEAFLNALIGLGLVRKSGDLYSNTRLCDKHYIRERSINWTRLYSSECVDEYQALLPLEEMLTTERSYQSILGIKRKDYVQMMKDDPQAAHDFTHMLYYDHQTKATALADYLDLRKHHRVLDVGGGSGVMSIGLVRKNRHLEACIFDIEPVLAVTSKILRREKLSGRIKVLVGDMTRMIPKGFDVIMLCDAGNSDAVLSKVWQSLPEGGMLVLAEDFSNDSLTDPFYRLMWQLRSNEFWLPTAKQTISRVRECGFRRVRHKRIHPRMGIITAHK